MSIYEQLAQTLLTGSPWAALYMFYKIRGETLEHISTNLSCCNIFAFGLAFWFGLLLLPKKVSFCCQGLNHHSNASVTVSVICLVVVFFFAFIFSNRLKVRIFSACSCADTLYAVVLIKKLLPFESGRCMDSCHLFRQASINFYSGLTSGTPFCPTAALDIVPLPQSFCCNFSFHQNRIRLRVFD